MSGAISLALRVLRFAADERTVADGGQAGAVMADAPSEYRIGLGSFTMPLVPIAHDNDSDEDSDGYN